MPKPYVRSRSTSIVVTGSMSWDPGGRCSFEVRTEENLGPSGRYRRWWLARKAGSLAWYTGRSPGVALRHAAGYEAGQRPWWLAPAIKRARKLVGPAGTSPKPAGPPPTI